MGIVKALSYVTLSLALLGCGHFNWYVHGVPLEDFTAQNGSYFPSFIKRYFPFARNFEKDHKVLSLAKDGVRLIQILPLTRQKSYQNETNLSWSADGVYLSYEIEGSRERKIMVKNLDGNYSKHLAMLPKTRLSGLRQSFNAALSWSKNSTRYAFMSNGGQGEYNIYLGAVGASKDTILAKSPSKDGSATWSPATNEIAFVSARSGGGDIYVLDLDSKELERLSKAPHMELYPEWSPDGENVVYSQRIGSYHQLALNTRKQGKDRFHKAHTLTKWPYDNLRPIVSPNGRYISFYANSARVDGKTGWNIHVVPFSRRHTYSMQELKDTIVARNVVLDLHTGPAWTPDSQKILYVKKDSKYHNPICAYELFTGRRYRLNTGTKMNRDILISKLGVISFRAQMGAWDKVFVALTNQGLQLQKQDQTIISKIHYLDWKKKG